jgi:hypothetical protein
MSVIPSGARNLWPGQPRRQSGSEIPRRRSMLLGMTRGEVTVRYNPAGCARLRLDDEGDSCGRHVAIIPLTATLAQFSVYL